MIIKKLKKVFDINLILKIIIYNFDKLNKLTDETLDSSNYSREEINQGLNDILDKFGIKIDFK